MAKKYGIEYVNFYTDGSAARKIAPALRSVKAMLPKPRKQKRRVIYLDPVAVLGTTVAVCMLIMMFVGMARLSAVRQQTQEMEQYVHQLQVENEQLSRQYHDGYDINEVERTALALGMVPQSQVQKTQIQMSVPAEQNLQTLSVWERISTFLSSLLA